MAGITLKGNACNTCGDLPAVGSAAPAFTLVGGDLGDVTLDSVAGKKVILNIVPSFDTPTCATSVQRTFQRIYRSLKSDSANPTRSNTSPTHQLFAAVNSAKATEYPSLMDLSKAC